MNIGQKKVLVTGGAGFIGSHLCNRLVVEGNDVICVDNFYTGKKSNVENLLKDKNFELLRHDVTFPLYLEIDEIYNLAAQSHVRVSFDQPTYTADVTAVGTLRLLEAIRDVQDDTGDQIRFYHASSS